MQRFMPEFRQIAIQLLTPLSALLLVLIHFSHPHAALAASEVIVADKNNASTNLSLTPSELEWLKNNRQIKVAVKSSWMPIEFKLENNTHKGISVDYLSELSNLLQVDFVLVNDDDETDFKQIDMVSGVSNRAFKSADFQLLDQPYLKPSFAIYTNSAFERTAHVESIKDLDGLKVAVFKYSSLSKEIQQKYPNIELVYVDIVDEAFDILQSGEIDAYIGNEIIVDYYIIFQRLLSIKKSALAPFTASVSMAVKKDKPMLIAIMNKALLAMEPKHDEILSRWKINDNEFESLEMLLGALLVILSIILFKAYRLRQIVNKQHVDSQRQIWNQANYDYLTKLPNRHLLENRLNSALRKASKTHSLVGVLFIDLDHFKKVNDQSGHAVGDSLLIDAANRINGCVRAVDTTARFGGDEFIVVITDTKEVADLENTCQRILQSLQDPFAIENNTYHISASIGLAMYPDNGRNPAELLSYADMAMFEAKKLGRNRFQFFNPAIQMASAKRVSITNDVRQALLEKQFILFYQPIVHLADEKIRKAEALIRWNHPTKGIISPVEFIPLAEESGLVHELGEWCFEQVLQDLQTIRNHLNSDFQISINVSPHQFTKPENLLKWIDEMRSLNIPGASIAIEITEGLLLEPSSAVRDTILALRDAGIEFSIDDFGTGYSALAYLKKFHIEYVKIDKSFIQNLEHDDSDKILCEAIIDMAHKLGIKIVAEGIETDPQKEALIQFGCDYGQGFLLARPERLSQLLKKI